LLLESYRVSTAYVGNGRELASRVLYHGVMTRQLETNRLILRPLELADAEDTQLLFPHWELVRFLESRVPWPYPGDGALTYYRETALPAMARGDEWHWSLRLKQNPDHLIGGISLKKTADNNRGFWIGLPWQGQGLMTEAVERVTDFWFEELGFPQIRVMKATLNAASRRISEKSGMRVVGRHLKSYVSGEFESEVWVTTAEEWRIRRTGRVACGGEASPC
jgi:ribosomal-protein-alanine N-acetyltransferase